MYFSNKFANTLLYRLAAASLAAGALAGASETSVAHAVASGVPTPPLAPISCVPGGLGISWGICRTIVPLSSRPGPRGARRDTHSAGGSIPPRPSRESLWSVEPLLSPHPRPRRAARGGTQCARGDAEGHIRGGAYPCLIHVRHQLSYATRKYAAHKPRCRPWSIMAVSGRPRPTRDAYPRRRGQAMRSRGATGRASHDSPTCPQSSATAGASTPSSGRTHLTRSCACRTRCQSQRATPLNTT